MPPKSKKKKKKKKGKKGAGKGKKGKGAPGPKVAKSKFPGIALNEVQRERARFLLEHSTLDLGLQVEQLSAPSQGVTSLADAAHILVPVAQEVKRRSVRKERGVPPLNIKTYGKPATVRATKPKPSKPTSSGQPPPANRPGSRGRKLSSGKMVNRRVRASAGSESSSKFVVEDDYLRILDDYLESKLERQQRSDEERKEAASAVVDGLFATYKKNVRALRHANETPVLSTLGAVPEENDLEVKSDELTELMPTAFAHDQSGDEFMSLLKGLISTQGPVIDGEEAPEEEGRLAKTAKKRQQEEEELQKLDEALGPVPQVYSGESAKDFLFKLYRRSRLRYPGRPATARTVYLEKCEKAGLGPEPMGVVRSNKTVDINLKAYGMGDGFAEAVAESLGMLPGVSSINLEDNQLSPRGAEVIVPEVGKWAEQIDLSKNQIGKRSNGLLDDRGIKSVTRLLLSAPKLRSLNLSENNLGDDLVSQLCQALLGNATVTSLDISNNEVGNVGAAALGELLAGNSTLTRLLAAWNKIDGDGAIAICNGLNDNSTLEELNVSMNAFGASASPAQALGDAISLNKTLKLLDISFNRFDSFTVRIFAEKLRHNHTLLGLLCEGNGMALDARGFVSELGSTSDIDEKTGVNRTKANCWVTAGWREHRFVWIPKEEQDEADQVWLCLSIDDFKPEIMVKTESGVHELYRCVPPWRVDYFFKVGEKERCVALDQKRVLETPNSSFAGLAALAVAKTKWMEKGRLAMMNFLPRETKPRKGPMKIMFAWPRVPPGKAMTPHRPRSAWSLPKSVFTNYKIHNRRGRAKSMKAAFQDDIRYSKIHKVVKTEDELKKVQMILQEHYVFLQQVFKYYASQGGSQTYSIGSNSFTDFSTHIRIIEKGVFELKDLDTVFIATNVDLVKNKENPERALTRYEFLEAIVRIAVNRFVRTKILPTPSEAVERLLCWHILPRARSHNPSAFRMSRLYNEDCDNVFKKYNEQITDIWDHFATMRFPGEPYTLTDNQWLQLVDYCNIAETFPELTISEARFAFSNAQELVVNEMVDTDYKTLSYPEYLEALGWLGQFTIPEDRAECDPLSPYLEAVCRAAARTYQDKTFGKIHSLDAEAEPKRLENMSEPERKTALRLKRIANPQRAISVVRTGEETEVIMVPQMAIEQGRASVADLFPSKPSLRKTSSSSLRSRVGSSVGLRRTSSVPSTDSTVGEVHHNRFAPHHQSKKEEIPEYAGEVEADFATFLARGGGPGVRADKSQQN